MGKKKKQNTNMDISDGKIITENKKKISSSGLSIFNFSFGSLNSRAIKRRIFVLIFICLVTNFLILIVTPTIFHSFIDLFDFGYYIT